jgi:Gas vesicle synthesis protein GvpO
MAERRVVRRTRQQRDDEPVEDAEDDVTGEPDDELAEEPDDELAEEPDDEADVEEPDDELAEEPDDEADVEEPDDEADAEEPEDEADAEEPRQASDGGRRSGPRSRRPRDGGIKPAKAGQLAMRQIAELTGKQPEGVTGIERGDDGWIVGVEVVEDRRVPSSSDVLATYATEIDPDGELLSYRRVKRYLRGRGDSEDS